MGMLVLAGRLGNLLSRGTVSVSDENPDFLKASMYDGDSGSVFAFNGVGPFSNVVLDTDLGLDTGRFDVAHVAGAPPSWTWVTAGTGSLTQDTSIKSAGASSCRMNSGTAGQGVLEKMFLVRAGETLTVKFDFRGDNTNAGVVTIFDMETGQYLNSVNAWVSGLTAYATRSANTFLTFTSQFVMSSMATWPVPVRRLRIRFHSASFVNGAQAWVDEFTLCPAYDTIAVVGHNVRPAYVLQFETSTVSNFASVVVTVGVVPLRDKFYYRHASLRNERFVRAFIGGISDPHPEPVFYGEFVIGQMTALTRMAASPIETAHVDHRVFVPRLIGGSGARALARSPRHTKSFTFQFPDTPATAETGLWRDWYNEVVLRSVGGISALLVPTTDRQEILLGRFPDTFREADGAPGQAGYKALERFDFEEQPLPVELP